MKIIVSLALLCLTFFTSVSKSEDCPFSQSLVTGASATFYIEVNSGNCGYESLLGPLGPGNLFIAALGDNLYNSGKNCGQCFNISSPYTNRSVVVMATDRCPDSGYCQRSSHFDLSTQAFDVLGQQSTGVLDGLTYFKVPCAVNGNVKIMMKDGSNDYWTAFLIYNNRVTIKDVSVKVSGKTTYQSLTQSSYNYWISPNMVPGSFDVRIESVGGEFIYITIPKVESRKQYETSSQFNTEGCVGEPNGSPSGGISVGSPSDASSLTLCVLFLFTILFLMMLN
ncbi:hypothetical protein RB653_007724 [Dictyostelium firmibasis]|uniref:Expansin-like EG45 domain-containing protein n=1 Tax=Dictyostelium firmibasis TaxID=79012 RepID=A0AAN7TWZ6_9MYCE